MALMDFMAPPQHKPEMAKELVDKEYKQMRLKVFLGIFFGYAAYYLVRKNLSLAAPYMIGEGLIIMNIVAPPTVTSMGVIAPPSVADDTTSRGVV